MGIFGSRRQTPPQQQQQQQPPNQSEEDPNKPIDLDDPNGIEEDNARFYGRPYKKKTAETPKDQSSNMMDDKQFRLHMARIMFR